MTIDTAQGLREHLQWSLQIEHGTLPPYMCALYSIKEGTNLEAAEVIQSVFIEEMLHLTLAANILNAVGGAPVLDSPDLLPSYPAFLPHSSRAFELSIQKFSPQAVELFMAIEKPGIHDCLPEDDSYETIGQFYEAIGEALVRLSAELGERALFCGDPARQVTDALYYGGAGRIIAVSDLDSAQRALAEIVEQGEGIDHQAVWDGDRDMFHPDRDEVAHYFRFSELAHGRRHVRGDTPQSGPTGESFAVDWGAVHNMGTNPRSADYAPGSEIRTAMDEFNRSYCSVLHLLHLCFNGSPGLLAPATGAMYALKEQATDLMRLPSGRGAETVGPSFEYIAPEERHRTQAGKIVVLPNGPYLVSGNIPLVRKTKLVSENVDALNWQKTAVLETEETYALCRCGQSSSKPFCDGTHARIGFDGSETADPRDTEERQRVLDGTGFVVRRDGSLCMHAAFCVGATRRIPAMMPDTADSDVRAHVMALIDRCPSGSYTYALDLTSEDIEPDLPTAIAVTTEENDLAGALWVTGGIPILRSDGAPLQTRNRVTLCRCGHSQNKPLCDGTHREIHFSETSDPQAVRDGASGDPAAAG
jgi:CDGSH-type Zn-finger protein